MDKIFGIGFHKTGTKSLAVALRRLGYRVTGPNGTMDPDIAGNALQIAHRLLDGFDAFQDNPWPVLYKEMDSLCPGSKFVLTTRDPQDWMRSVVRHFGSSSSPMREWIYGVGCPLGNESRYLQRYERHNQDVMDYFSGRNDDLLTVNFAEADGWRELCAFLGKPMPPEQFPHANSAENREQRLNDHC